jgi:serine/threonine protein phosphatase PrpC
MTSTTLDSAATLLVQPGATLTLQNWHIQVEEYLGFSPEGVNYFRVVFQSPDSEAEAEAENSQRLGLLRVGQPDGGLKRELDIRETLGEFKMVSDLLFSTIEQQVQILSQSSTAFVPETSTPEEEGESASQHLTDNLPDSPEYSNQIGEEQGDLIKPIDGSSAENSGDVITEDAQLTDAAEKPDADEEQYLDESEAVIEEEPDPPSPHLLVLSPLPEVERTFETWLQREQSTDNALAVVIQVCQFCNYLYKQGWHVVHLFPSYVQLGTPSRFFDLTGIYPPGEQPDSSYQSPYCAPEVLSKPVANEQISTYLVASLLHRALHGCLPTDAEAIASGIKLIPRIHQILDISLGKVENRFPLAQLLSLLVKTRQELQIPQVHWQVAARSTVGLSPSRLQNEDNYGIKQWQSSIGQSYLLAVVADGMGGMAKGEVASQLAVETLLAAEVPTDLEKPQQWSDWLCQVVQKANAQVMDAVRDGGTTLSALLAVGQDLVLAHVGDSRAFLIRNKTICQLSEDHSLVAMLLNSGQITYEESQTHEDRNVLTRSLGSVRQLSQDYVQTLNRFGESSSLLLQDGDVLTICSDGVWDLVTSEDFCDIFENTSDLQLGVNEVIQRVLQKGAHDNATIIALRCTKENSF